MALGLRDGRRLERHRRRMRMLRALAVVVALFLLGMFAYETGAQLAQREVKLLRDEIRTLRETVADLNDRNAALESARQEALAREAEAKDRYARDVPTGAARDLFMLMQERLSDGFSPERLAFVVENAGDGTRCDNRPQTKRFILRTPVSGGRNDWVGFNNTAIVVTGEGQSAVNEQGAPFGWFDRDKPVTIIFTLIGGEKHEATGMLPLHHSVVRNGNEFRFTVTEGDSRGFINVTADRCDYP